MAQGLCHEVHAFDVDTRDFIVDTFTELILAVRILWIHKQTRDVDACVVDEDVELAKSRFCLLDHRCDALRFRDIGHDVEQLSPAPAELKFRLVRVHVTDYDIRTIIEK